ADVPNTEGGIRHATRIADYVMAEYDRPDIVIHSGYQRVLPIVERFEQYGVKTKKDVLVREREPGYCHNMLEEEMKEQFPFLSEYWKRVGPFYAVPPGGESIAQLCENRARPFCQSLAAEKLSIGVVLTHKRFIWGVRRELEGWGEDCKWPEGQDPANGSIIIYQMWPGKATFEGYVRIP